MAGGTVILSIVVLLGGYFYARSRDSATVVPVGAVIDEFRDTELTGFSAPRRPEPGVYVFDTVGEERVDALGGTSHEYPAETTITITPTECGYRSRWDALRERWDETDLCVNDGGESIKSARQYHEFFGWANNRVYQCDPDHLIRLYPPRPGDRRSVICSDQESTTEMVVTVVGTEDVVVAGVAVPALHVTVETRVTGSVRGNTELDYWADPETGLVLRRHSIVSTDADSPLGTTKYEEEYTIELRSLEPRT